VERSDCNIDLENRAVARPIVARPARLSWERGAVRSNRWRNVCSSAAAAAFGLMLWFGGGSLELTARPDNEVTSQPTAARPALASRAPVLTGLFSESLDKPASDTPPETRAERAERRKARKEAARAKREAAAQARHDAAEEKREARRERYAAKKQARLEAAEARHDSSQEKRDAARERYAAKKQARIEAAEARRDASQEKRDAARERYAAKKQARLEAAEARKEAAREKRELARAGREPVGSADAIPESTSFGSSGLGMASGAASGAGGAGILRINSLPWSQVFIDGRMVGYTPQRGISLPPGDHDVRLVNPSFHMRKTLQVRIAQGQQVTRSEILEE